MMSPIEPHNSIHAVVLTLNEELHIERCINSIAPHCSSITVVDSGSSDRTVELAASLGARVVSNRWVNYASQMNFGIDQLSAKGGWVLRIDCDEVLEVISGNNLSNIVSSAHSEVDGILLQRRIHFLGQRIRFGAIEPSWQLRLFRNGRGRCEQRWMDEHIVVPGRIQKSKIVISDINLKPLSWWINKHNSYSSREAIDVLNRKYQFINEDKTILRSGTSQAKFRRFLKRWVYAPIPSGLRAWLYFIYRYIFRLGLLDGRKGFTFHFLQGLWYRSLVDAKIQEIEQFALTEKASIVEAIRDRTGFDPLAK